MGTAVLVANLSGYRGDARLYKVSPPAEYRAMGDGYDAPKRRTDYVIVSAVFVPFSGPETYIFPATSDPEAGPINCIDLPGSLMGYFDHARALECGGWDLMVDAVALPPNETGIVDIAPSGWEVIE